MLIGLPGADESEGFDRTHMNLPANQLAALRAVAAANPNVVVVLVNGSTVVLGDVTAARRGAGRGVAGRPGRRRRDRRRADRHGQPVRPAGRDHPAPAGGQLAPTSTSPATPRSSATAKACSSATAATTRPHTRRRVPVRLRPVLHRPSRCRDLDVATPGSVADGTWPRPVTVTVTNTGPVAGAEVVQVYVRDVEASVARPVRELKGFAKVSLEPGASQHGVDRRSTSAPSRSGPTLLGRWVVEAGDFAIEVGRALAGPAAVRDRHRSTRPSSPRRSPPTRRCRSGWPTRSALELIERGGRRGPARPDPGRRTGRRHRHHADVHPRRLRRHEHRPRHPGQARRTPARTLTGVPRLLLINGLPGSGKSTLAARYVADRPLALCLDIDVVRGLFGAWTDFRTRPGCWRDGWR